MKKVLISAVLILAFCSSAFASSYLIPKHGELSPRGVQATSGETCRLFYHNYCSFWTYTWTAYNGTPFSMLAQYGLPPAKIGVCYDLSDCSLGCDECKHLDDVWWAFDRFTDYGRVDIEIFRANPYCCPIGDPIAVFYDYHVPLDNPWLHLILDGLPLDMASCKFIVMATILTPMDCVPYSDSNLSNLTDGCETQWRCTGHSYCYRNLIDYCSQSEGYGPGPMIVYQPGACGDVAGFYVEWITYAYVDCRGPMATERNTWSEIKAFYR